MVVATAYYMVYTIGIRYTYNVPEANNSISVSVYLFSVIELRNYRFTKSLTD